MKSVGWLEKYHAGIGDEGEATAILNTYLNVADQFKSEDDYEEALRLCNRGSEIATIFNRPSHKGDFLWVSAQIFQRQGNLDQALSVIHESEKLLDPGTDWMTKGGQTSNFQNALVYEGRILGDDNYVSFGRSDEAVQSLDRAFQIADALVHRDANDQSWRGNLAMAGISMGDILRHSDARRALEIYDHTLRYLAEVPNNPHLERFEVELLAGSSYALRQLGRAKEADQRLEDAFAHLKQLKFNLDDKMDINSEGGKTLRALADSDAERGDLSKAIEIYEKLLNQMDRTESDKDFNLEDAVHLSSVCRSATALYRRAHQIDKASILERRRLELWRHWDQEIPNNAFVRHQLDMAGTT